MRTEDFDYELPESYIAQSPVEPRDSCRLLCLDCDQGSVEHKVFTDIEAHLHAGDVLVVNNTRVLPARLHGLKRDTGGSVEVLLLKERGQATPSDAKWECLVKPAKRVREGHVIDFGEQIEARVLEEGEKGQRTLHFSVKESAQDQTLSKAFHAIGEMPLPPYITKKCEDPEQYQTVFSKEEHSAAAPTAGLHFTPELLERLRRKGVIVAEVELQVGLDTFRIVEADDPREHHIHTEKFCMPQKTADIVNAAKKEGRRVVAVGTTSVRSLESSYDQTKQQVVSQVGDTSLFILPGYTFKVVDALITNFHVPRSSLMMLVSAFAGRDMIFSAYEEAMKNDYRFLSFGDAMFLY